MTLADKIDRRNDLVMSAAALRLLAMVACVGLLIATGLLTLDRLVEYGKGVLGPLRVTIAFACLAPLIAFWGASVPDGRSRHARPTAIVLLICGLIILRIELLAPWLVPRFSLLQVGIAGLLFAHCLKDVFSSRPRVGVALVGQTGERSFWLGLVYCVLIAVVLPLAFLASVPLQLYPPPGWIDAGIYLGLSFDFLEIVRQLGWNYYALRVSAILPGFMAGTLLEPEAARIATVALLMILGTLSLYAGATLLWGRMAATVAVALLAYNPIFLLALGSGYVDAAYVPYLCLAFAAYAAWWTSHNAGWIVLAGAGTMLAALAHPLAILPAGMLALMFLVAGFERVRQRPMLLLGAGFLGAVSVSLYFLLGLSNVDFHFGQFLKLRWIVESSLSGIGERYRVPVEQWLPHTTRLFPALLAAAGLLIVGARARDRRLAVGACVATLAVAIFLPLYDVALKGALSQSSFYAGLTLLGTIVGTASLVAALSPSSFAGRAGLAIVATAMAIGFSAAAPLFWSLADEARLPPRIASFSLGGIAALAVIAAGLHWTPRLRFVAALFVVALTIGAYGWNADTRGFYREATDPDYAEFFRAAVLVRNAISDSDAAGRRPLFWYHRGAFAPHDGNPSAVSRTISYRNQSLELGFFDTLASLRQWDRSLFSDRLPHGVAVDAARLPDSSVALVILAQDTDAFEDARIALGRAGVACQGRQRQRIEESSFILLVDILWITGRRAADELPCDR